MDTRESEKSPVNLVKTATKVVATLNTTQTIVQVFRVTNKTGEIHKEREET